MKVEIKLTRHEVSHLSSPHSFTVGCGTACDVLYKVQRQIDKNKKVKR